MSKERSSTIGEQRRYNYALKEMGKEEFVRMMTSDLPEAPDYFSMDARMNREGAAALSELGRPSGLSAEEVERLRDEGRAVVLDVRTAAEFGAGHVPGALNVGLGGQFASWAGSLIKLGTPIVVVAEDEEKVDEAVMRLARVGHETVVGYLAGGVEAWRESGRETAGVEQVTVEELRRMLDEEPRLQVLDVRRPSEYESGHAPRAVSAPLSPRLKEAATSLDPSRPLAVICAGGYRSSAATSILRPLGFEKIYNVAGGTNAWVAARYEVERPVAAQHA